MSLPVTQPSVSVDSSTPATEPVAPVSEPSATTPVTTDSTSDSAHSESDCVKPNLLQKVQAATKSRGALLAERDEFKHRAQISEKALEQVQNDLATAQADLSRLHDEHAQIEKALEVSEAENKTVAAEATEQIVSLGVQPEALPAAATDGDNSVDSLVARMEATSDPSEKGRLAKQIRKIEDAD